MQRCSEKAFAMCQNRCQSMDVAFFLPGSECDHFNQVVNKPMTNADRIRAMTNEDLCELLMASPPCDSVSCLADTDCKECILAWLRQPAEGGTT